MFVRLSLALHWTFFFFFNDPATTEIYTLSLHDALPICLREHDHERRPIRDSSVPRRRDRHHRHCARAADDRSDRKSTRLNSSHSQISYAVFCLKKKKRHKEFTESHKLTVITSLPHPYQR